MVWTVRKVTLLFAAVAGVGCGSAVTPDDGGSPERDAGAAGGGSCLGASDCASGHCVDGVCCDVACEGPCLACVRSKTGAADGTCAPISTGSDPDEECAGGPGTCLTGACDGVGACARLADGDVCRPALGACDVAERCNIDVCPPDDLAPPTMTCRAAAGPCDVVEVCSGTSAACPADVRASSTTSCRPASGDCDVGETCDGSSVDCPPDAVSPATTECRPARGACDVAETCSGASATCPLDVRAPPTQSCRPAAGDCDVAEQCTGLSDDCPADVLLSSTTLCRPSFGACDPEERCTGTTPACPPDLKSTDVCRVAAGTCDVAERCDGVSDACPVNAFVPSTSDVCAPYRCSGSGPTCGSGACTNDNTCSRGAFCRGGVCVQGKRVFVTSTAVAGNFGGLAAADALCAARATAANLPGTFKAWLSTSTTSAASRLTHATVPYYRRSGLTVVRLAQNWTELTSNTSTIPGAITFDENGATVTARVWTGTSPAGASAIPTCNEWTSAASSDLGRQGDTQAQDVGWWTNQGFGACNSSNRLYCFEQ